MCSSCCAEAKYLCSFRPRLASFPRIYNSFFRDVERIFILTLWGNFFSVSVGIKNHFFLCPFFHVLITCTLESKTQACNNGKVKLTILRTVPLFTTARTFCASHYGPRTSNFLRKMPTNSVTIELYFYRKKFYEKCVVTPSFLFGFHKPLLRSAFPG